MGSPRVSVFIPTLNGGALFERVLDGILAQETPFEFEVICIDSGSTDGTREKIEERSLRLETISRAEFNHGLVRNTGARMARGEILVLTVQDAIPIGRDWMATLVSNFEDPDVAGAYCHQKPRPNCSPFLKERLAGWVRGQGRPETRCVDRAGDFWLLPPLDRWRCIAFDNVCSAVRRELVITRLPFVRRQFGEDITWAKSAILAGYKIVMDPRCAVEHSHDSTIWYEFRRAYLDHQNIHNLTDLQLAPDIHKVFSYSADLAARLFDVVCRDERLSRFEKALWAAKIPWFAFSQNLAQWLGGLSDRARLRGAWGLFDRWVRRGI